MGRFNPMSSSIWREAQLPSFRTVCLVDRREEGPGPRLLIHHWEYAVQKTIIVKKVEVARTEQNRIQRTIQDLQHQVVPRQTLKDGKSSQEYKLLNFKPSSKVTLQMSLMMEKGKHPFKGAFPGRTRWADTKRWILTWALLDTWKAAAD